MRAHAAAARGDLRARARGQMRVLRRDCTLRGVLRSNGLPGCGIDAWREGGEGAARALQKLARDGNPATGTRVSEETAQ